MAGSNVHANDGMIRRLDTELSERETFANGIIARANDAERDLTDDEKGLLKETRGRMESIKSQIEELEDISRVAHEVRNRSAQVDRAITSVRNQRETGAVEYRSAGAFALDLYRSSLGHREASERLETFYRQAAHQKTSDEPGVIPDPIVGDVINFIDAARPIVSALGPRNLPAATWHRPKVTQHTSVGVQGSAGAAADEKTELVSQKMTITRLTANAVTYGGYVNVSKQSIDFSQPSVLDIVINDLAAQYAIETEAATAAAIADTNTAAVEYDPTEQDSVAAAVWAAAAQAYSAVRGQGRLLLVVAPDRLATFGPLFAPYGPQNQQGQGFSAANFGQGVMGSISGVPTVMSSGLGAGEAFLVSSSALEVYEQRVGTLQVTEPSVLGVQVAYAGYFTPLTISAGGIVPLESSGS
ncbi:MULTISPECIES: phage major capsid protein [Mycobacteroides]|uniref:phage major capsid protein n=1 Tax=Mycobacteroides TaxID=670516 RepID=UPI0009A8DCFA|nr:MULTISPECIES: phage major capsid protein [Mycobacteroides]QQG96218.1 phage major capsid protein [Mycobacteroides chelonae]SLH42928.1 phage major capsid protein, HK97 family [Mycobacteroides abscessus subsp. abscessus]